MSAHKLVPHLSSQHALARMAKTLSFHTRLFVEKKIDSAQKSVVLWKISLVLKQFVAC
jgi:hypothetical protein